MDLAPRNNVLLMFMSNHVFDNCCWREVQRCRLSNKNMSEITKRSEKFSVVRKTLLTNENVFKQRLERLM